MKYMAGIILSILIGILIGFFGVFVSVFADGGLTERMISIGVILLIYTGLNVLLGFLLPDFSWKWGLLSGTPGVSILGIYMTREYNPYFMGYMALILCVSCFGAWSGSHLRNRRKPTKPPV